MAVGVWHNGIGQREAVVPPLSWPRQISPVRGRRLRGRRPPPPEAGAALARRRRLSLTSTLKGCREIGLQGPREEGLKTYG